MGEGESCNYTLIKQEAHCQAHDLAHRPTILTEQVNSVPFLLGLMEDLGIRTLIDAHVRPHGHWRGITVGTLLTIWLAYILRVCE